MAIKIVLRKRKNKDGTQPLILQVFKNNKASTIHLGYHLHEADWDGVKQRVKKTHPNATRLNNFLIKKLAEAHNSSLELETEKKNVSSHAVLSKIKSHLSSTFNAQAEDYLDSLKKAGKYNQYTSDKPRIARFKEFLGNRDIAFSDITPGLLEKFTASMSVRRKSKNSKETISQRTIVNHLVVLRSVFAHARKNKVITKEQSPFGEGGVKIKFPDTRKVGITAEDVEKLETVQLSDARHDHARKLWLFSFYLAGMRVSDVMRLKWSDVRDGRLHYSMGKNEKGGSLKLPEKAVAILEDYLPFKNGEVDFIFPELKGCDLSDTFKTKRTIAFKTSAIDKILRLHVAPSAGIDKKLTMHISRHTFAGLAGDAIPIQMLQKLYRHSNVSTTIGYQGSFIHKDADDALDAVLNNGKKKSPTHSPR